MNRKQTIWKLVHTGFLSAGMSGLVAFIVTLINTGLDSDLIGRWLIAWSLAFPVAWFAALLWGPGARWLTERMLGKAPSA